MFERAIFLDPQNGNFCSEAMPAEPSVKLLPWVEAMLPNNISSRELNSESVLVIFYQNNGIDILKARIFRTLSMVCFLKGVTAVTYLLLYRTKNTTMEVLNASINNAWNVFIRDSVTNIFACSKLSVRCQYTHILIYRSTSSKTSIVLILFVLS